jgi:hypothetical protein
VGKKKKRKNVMKVILNLTYSPAAVCFGLVSSGGRKCLHFKRTCYYHRDVALWSAAKNRGDSKVGTAARTS